MKLEEYIRDKVKALRITLELQGSRTPSIPELTTIILADYLCALSERHPEIFDPVPDEKKDD